MNNFLLKYTLLLIFLIPSVNNTMAQTVSIPDTNFEQALIDLGIDTNGLNGNILETDALAVTSLNVNDSNISSLEGIEGFANLEVLFCQRNQLTSIDITQNLALEELECESNQFSSLDVSQNTALRVLGCALNNLTSLDVSNNLLLEAIWCTDNNITSLNLDLNTALNVYGLSNNPLSDLSIKNGNNHNTVYSVMENLPNLSCITVDDETDTATHAIFNTDAGVIFSNNCNNLLNEQLLEREALIALYNSADGPNWTDNTNWNTAEPVSTWAGITVVNGHVTRIDKNRGNLVGTLPVELQNLTHLEYLQLSRNNLSGSIPDLTGLTNLSFFNINLNDFQFADFENEFASYNSNVANFYCTVMNKVELESDVDLVVGQTYAMNMPVINGTGVTYQWYKNNEPIVGETGLTYTITNAQEGDAGNYTCKASSSIVTSLEIERETVHIYRELLASDRAALVALYNATNGPSWTTNTNWNTAAPVYQWHGVTVSDNRVIEIILSSNNLVGTLPTQIGDLDALEKINLSFNQLTGNIPVELGNCTGLTELTLWNNNLSGTIPSELGNCTSLIIFSLEDNQLTGNIPTSFSNITTMFSFWVNGNQLSGDVPDIFASWPDLYYFSIGDANGSGSYNNFTGTVDLSNNPDLRGCWVDNTNISFLNIQNGTNETINVNQLIATNTPNLTCIQVDNSAYSALNWTHVDPTASFSTDCSNTTTIAIPDANFEQALIDLGFDTNGLNGNILETNALGVTLLNVIDPINNENLPNVNAAITDLTGIEGFTNLVSLYASDNSINTIDVSQNTALEYLYLANNQLTGLDISNNSNLIRLVANDNAITTLDVTQNVALERLQIENNQISTIDVTNNTALILLYLENNLLTSVDVSQNTSLLNLAVGFNPITSLDITMLPQLPILTTEGTLISSLDLSNNINLKQLWVADNPNLTNIDLSNNPLLFNLGAYNTPIESLDLSNNAITRLYANDMPNLYRLDLSNGNNTNVTDIFLTNNPSLVCISVDDVAYSTANWTDVDVTASFSEDCNGVWTVYTPDENFSDAMSDYITIIDGDNDGVITYEEASSYTGTLDFSNQSIEDITGLEAFTSVTEINLQGNSITDLSGLIDSDALILTRSGEFKTVERRNFTALQVLNCSNNNLTSLDVSIIETLTSLDCSNNQLEVLNVKNGNNINFTNFDASGNPGLYCVLVDDATVAATNWTAIDVQSQFSDTDCYAKLQPKVFLQGAMLNPVSGEEHLMRDDLRSLGHLPTTSPYSDGLTCDVSVFNVTGDNAIVDWVEVSLRDASNMEVILESRSALLQRDGDVVDVDGVSGVAFTQWAKVYYVSFHHRNHLGIMSNDSSILNFVPEVYDFTDGSIAAYGSHAQVTLDSGNAALWAGNVNGDGRTRFQGSENDTNVIKDLVLTHLNNTSNNNLFFYFGYDNADVDMDGRIRFQGSGNDSNLIKDIILSHPDNTVLNNLFFILSQIPNN
ncbi:immunoglobulin domain-containing protein [Xanthomarina sp. F2636L]|uniref:immunoglobulin domain-containing protein n=1 Tax=Xanthomarina sp. F2636L TaxID=2996018 RepID=UPI00225E3152|nr:immunoglobulin domain-containing protein [Xanthomarina sp. F2636L]MCX7549415.1 hypothetical protein [Xanthomarina sp. F2636L]